MTERVTPEEVARMHELRSRGYTYRAIQFDTGRSMRTLQCYLNPGYKGKIKKRREERRLQDPEWYSQHLKKRRDHKRGNRLFTNINGEMVHINVKKRPHPGGCELCGRSEFRLGYHHWDDHSPGVGLWLCFPCHQWAHGVDKGLSLEDYQRLKERANDWEREIHGEYIKP